jgi:hypothetical protein
MRKIRRMREVKAATLQRALGLILGVALVVAIALTSFGERRVDFWWQLPQGLSILATHHLPAQPPDAFGAPRQPFVDEYSLYEIGLALLDQLGGFTAIHLAFLAVYFAIYLVPLLGGRTLRCDPLSAGLLALATLFLINRHEERPELVGVLLLVLLVALLRRTHDCSPGFLLRLALLFAIWTGVHSSYVIGLTALVLWLGDRACATEPAARWSLARAALVFVVAAGALLINPYEAGRIVFTFEEENDIGSNLLSREMWPAWDQTPGTIALVAATAILLGFAIVRQPRPARWLAALAVGLFLLALAHIRHMSFLSVPLLFLCADRLRLAPPSGWGPLRVLALAAGCIAVLIFDGVAATSALADLRLGDALTDRGFAPGLFRQSAPKAVLCHDAEGSFLTFRDLFPLIDSGQGRFDDATKRYYFFTVQDPYAFNRALDQLTNLDDVVVTAPVGGWTLSLMTRPEWLLAACEPEGLRFHRLMSRDTLSFYRRGIWIVGQPARNAIRFRDQALKEHDYMRAFSFSVLVDPPSDSLALLDRSRVENWSEPFFSFTRAWVHGLNDGNVAPFIRSHPQPANTLLREIFLARSGPDQPLPPPGPSPLERLARILTLLERNDPTGAKALFTDLRPPMVSPLYYALRDRLDPPSARQATAAERWQDWNADGDGLFDQTGPALNDQIATKMARHHL